MVDLSEANLTEITSDGLRTLADFIASVFKKHNIAPTVAVYAPKDLPYGLAKVYSIMAEEFETYHVCRSSLETVEWLKKARNG